MSVNVDRIYVRSDPRSKASDLRAIFDSYRFRFKIGEKVYIEAPLWMFAMVTRVGLGARYSERPRPPYPELPLNISDPTACTGELERAGMQTDEQGVVVNKNARWPFWVGEDLTFQFLFRTPEGWLVQEFFFEPGRKYETVVVRGFLQLLGGLLSG